MTFLHDDPEFEQLLVIVARDAGISEAPISYVIIREFGWTNWRQQ